MRSCCRHSRPGTSTRRPTRISFRVTFRCSSRSPPFCRGAGRLRLTRRPRRASLWRRAAVALELTALAALGVALLVTTSGPVRLKWADTVIFSIRGPWRAWTLFAVCVALRAALVRRASFDPVGRLRSARDAIWRGRAARRPGARNPDAVVYAIITIIAVWLATGPAGGLWPRVYWWPGLNFIRVPSRFVLLAVLGLAILAGMGFERLTTGMSARRRNLLTIAAGVWLVAEFAAMPLATEAARVDIPAIDRWLAGQPTPFVIVEVPLAGNRRNSEYMLHSTAHWQKTVEGYSGMSAPFHDELFRQLRSFPDAASLDELTAIGVTYVVVHTDLYAPEEWQAVEARIDRFQDRLALVHIDGMGRVYRLRP